MSKVEKAMSQNLTRLDGHIIMNETYLMIKIVQRYEFQINSGFMAFKK